MSLRRISIQDIHNQEDAFFHFTDEANLYDNEKGRGIISRGLTSFPRNRPHTVGKDQEHPCIFFVQGFGGILELMDVWIRFEYSKLVGSSNYPHGDIKIDQTLMQEAYRIFYEKFKHSNYFKLDLIAGDNPETSDFNPNEEDFKKKRYFRASIYNEKEAIDNQFAKWNYGVNTNYKTATMDRWNMTTHINHQGEKIIPPEKIEIIEDSRGRTDAISVIREIYQKFRHIVKDVDDLDGFMQYLIAREEKENSKERRGYILGRETIDLIEDTIYIDETADEMKGVQESQRASNAIKG